MRNVENVWPNAPCDSGLMNLFVLGFVVTFASSSLFAAGDMNTGGDASNTWQPGSYATALPSTIIGTGTIGGYYDSVDHYRLPVSAHQFVRVSLSSAYAGVYLTVFGPNGIEQRSASVGAGQSATIVGYANTSGYMYVRLYWTTGSSTYYSLTVVTSSPQQMDVSWQPYLGLTPINPPQTPPPIFWDDFFNPDGSLRYDVYVIGGSGGPMINTNVSPGILIQHMVWADEPEPGGYVTGSWEGDVASGNVDYGDSNGGSHVSVSGSRGSAQAELMGKVFGKEAGVTLGASVNTAGITISLTIKSDGLTTTYSHTGELVEYDPFSIHEETQKQFVLWGIPFNIGLEGWGSAKVKGNGKIAYGLGGNPSHWVKEFGVHAEGSLGASPSLAIGVDNSSFAVEAGVEVKADLLDAKFDYVSSDSAPAVNRCYATGTLQIGFLDFEVSLYAKLKIQKLLSWLNYNNKIKWKFYDPEPFAGETWSLVEPGEPTYDPPLPGP